jgi:hypothetical protein
MPKKLATPRTKRATTTVSRKKPVPSFAAPSADLIARRAYEMFIQQGAPHGRDLEHWLAAETELATTHN